MTTDKNAGSGPGAARLCRLVLVVLFTLAGSNAQGQENGALSILKAMSDYVGGQSTIELSFDSAIEVITPELEKIQFTNSGEALLQRPDKLRAHRKGGYSEVALFFDGKSVSVFSESMNSYAQFDGPATTDQLFEALRAGHGVALPGADLLMSNAYDLLAADVMEARHVGRGVVDGRDCEHLAFRNFDTDWQLWVEAGDRPVPRKMVITSKTLNGAPQYTLRVKEWKTGVSPKPGAFSFVPPDGAERLASDALIDFDELPQGAPAGGGE